MGIPHNLAQTEWLYLFSELRSRHLIFTTIETYKHWPLVSKKWTITQKPSILEQKLALMTYINMGILYNLVKSPCLYIMYISRS